MKTIYVWNNSNLISLKDFPAYVFHNRTLLYNKYFIPLVKERKTRFDYDDVNKIIVAAKQYPDQRTVHVILLSPYDSLPGVDQDELFHTCSVLVEQLQSARNLHLLILKFFPLPKKYSSQVPKLIRFQNRLRQFVRGRSNVTVQDHHSVSQTTLNLEFPARQHWVEQFYRDIIIQVSNLNF